MSHVAKMEVEIKDLDALEQACESLGLELARGQKHYKWYGHSVGDYPMPAGFTERDLGKCDHAIRIPGDNKAYEIGVCESKTGSGYTLLWDFWQGGYGMQAKVGTKGEKLADAYGAKMTAAHWRQKGFRVTETVEENRIVVRCRK